MSISTNSKFTALAKKTNNTYSPYLRNNFQKASHNKKAEKRYTLLIKELVNLLQQRGLKLDDISYLANPDLICTALTKNNIPLIKALLNNGLSVTDPYLDYDNLIMFCIEHNHASLDYLIEKAFESNLQQINNTNNNSSAVNIKEMMSPQNSDTNCLTFSVKHNVPMTSKFYALIYSLPHKIIKTLLLEGDANNLNAYHYAMLKGNVGKIMLFLLLRVEFTIDSAKEFGNNNMLAIINIEKYLLIKKAITLVIHQQYGIDEKTWFNSETKYLDNSYLELIVKAHEKFEELEKNKNEDNKNGDNQISSPVSRIN